MEESERVAIKMQQFSIKMQSERMAISLEAQHASNTAALSGDSPPSLPSPSRLSVWHCVRREALPVEWDVDGVVPPAQALCSLRRQLVGTLVHAVPGVCTDVLDPDLRPICTQLRQGFPVARDERFGETYTTKDLISYLLVDYFVSMAVHA